MLSWYFLNPTASLIPLIRAFSHMSAGWTSGQNVRDGLGEAAAQGGDRMGHVALGAQRQILGVGNQREGQIAVRSGAVIAASGSTLLRPSAASRPMQ